MKINGVTLSGPNVDILVIPRSDQSGVSQDIVFKAQAVLDYDDFDKLCPRPEPPIAKRPGGEEFVNVEHPAFKSKFALWGLRRTQWMILKSLSATESLVWDTVKIDDPETWGKYYEELRSSGFSNVEVNRITDLVAAVNGLSEEKFEEARKRFLAGQGQGQRL